MYSFNKDELEVGMNTANWILLLTSVSAAIVAFIGYFLNQVAARNERRSRVYAEALSAVFEFQELSYRIRKRVSGENSSAIVAQKISDVFVSLDFYRALLFLESSTVGIAYADLACQTQAQGDSHRADAWNHPAAASGLDFHFPVHEYRCDNGPELDLCMLAMQREMRLISVRRKSTERLLAQQRAQRAATVASSRANPSNGPVPTQSQVQLPNAPP
jgi:hypothetical protein